MRTPKPLSDFSKYSDTELDQAAAAIVSGMTGNANFPTPDPPLADITLANTAFQTAMTNAMNGGETQTAIKDDKREALVLLLQGEALYVEKEAAGNEAKILSSGFNVSKQPSPKGPLEKPGNFKVEAKGKGEMQLSINPINGAKSYQWEYRKVTDTAWTIVTTTKAKLLLTGLESGKEYTFRVVPIGASNIREYSDEINSFVL